MTIDVVLEKDLQWREAELASLKRLAINATSNSVTHQSLLRALWALLYAHYEGFTKFAWDTLLDHIQGEKLTKAQLHEQFALLALEEDFSKLRSGLDARSIWQFFHNELPAALSAEVEFPEKFRPTTKSNLWPEVFELQITRLGIHCDELHKSWARIKTLVSRRNEIAHGKSMTIASVAEYNAYETPTLCLMHELAIKAIETIDLKQYRQEATGLVKGAIPLNLLPAVGTVTDPTS